jgi:hypothetical protein
MEIKMFGMALWETFFGMLKLKWKNETELLYCAFISRFASFHPLVCATTRKFVCDKGVIRME